MVAEYKRSPTLGQVFVSLKTQVWSLGFTEGVDCLKDNVPEFTLESLPEYKRSFYDIDPTEHIDALIAEHEIFTNFGPPPEPDPETEAPDRLSNSWGAIEFSLVILLIPWTPLKFWKFCAGCSKLL